jgi:hypothetical protein
MCYGAEVPACRRHFAKSLQFVIANGLPFDLEEAGKVLRLKSWAKKEKK